MRAGRCSPTVPRNGSTPVERWQILLPTTRARQACGLQPHKSAPHPRGGFLLTSLGARPCAADSLFPSMRNINFYWQWEQWRPQPDPLMTRQRAARLLRSWRRARTQGRRVFGLTRVRLEKTRAYLVEHLATGERAGLYMCCASSATPLLASTVLTAHALQKPQGHRPEVFGTERAR